MTPWVAGAAITLYLQEYFSLAALHIIEENILFDSYHVQCTVLSCCRPRLRVRYCKLPRYTTGAKKPRAGPLNKLYSLDSF